MDGKKAKKQISSTTSPSTTSYKQFSQLKSKQPYPIPPPLSLRSRLQTVSFTKHPNTARPTTNTAQDDDSTKKVSKLEAKRPTSASASSSTFTTTLPPYAQSRLKKQQKEQPRPNTPKTSRGTSSKQKSVMSPRSITSSRCSSNILANGNINNKNSNNNHNTKNNNNNTKNNNNNNSNISSKNTKLVNNSNLKGPEKSRLSKSCTSARSNLSNSNNSILSGMSKEFKNSQLGADIQLFMSHPLFSTIMAENPELQNITTTTTTTTTTTKKTSRGNGSNKTSQIHENSRKSSIIVKKDESNNDDFDITNINDYQDLTDEKIHQEIETMLEKLHLEARKEQDKMIYHDNDHNDDNNSLVLLTNNAKNSISEATLNPALNSNQAKKLKSESNLKKKIPIQNFEATGSSSSTSSVNRNKSKMTVTKVPVIRTPSAHSHRERDKIEIPEEIKHLMNDDFDEEALRKKMVLLKNRYQHIVKTELHNLMAGDDDLLPENSTSPEFVKTLMGLVEKDKEIANIAVDLVQEIDLLETAEMSYSTKKALMGGDGDEKVAIFQELWQNHKACRTQITRNLEKERDELFKDKYIPETKKPNEQKNNNKTSSENHHSENNDETHSENSEIDIKEKQDHVDEKNPNLLKLQSEVTKDLQQVFFTDFFEKSMEKMKKQAKKVRESSTTINVENSLENNSTDVDKDLEIKRGLGKLLRRLDCDSSVVTNHNNSSNNMNDVLLLIQDKMKTLRENIQDLKKVSNKQNL